MKIIKIIIVVTCILFAVLCIFLFSKYQRRKSFVGYNISKTNTNITVLNVYKHVYVAALSPDSQFLAYISDQNLLIRKSMVKSIVFKSKIKFPGNTLYYHNTLWSNDGLYVIFSYFDRTKLEAKSVILDFEKNKEYVIPNLINGSFDNDNNHLIGYDKLNKVIVYIKYNPEPEIDSSLSNSLLRIPDEVFTIENFNWINNNAILCSMDVFNTTRSKENERVEKQWFDHAEIRTIDLNSQSSKLLTRASDIINDIEVFPDKKNAFVVQREEFFRKPDMSEYPGKSGIYNLSSTHFKFNLKKVVFGSISPNGEKILCSVYLPSKKYAVYGIYSVNTKEISLLKDIKSGAYIPSQIDCMYGKDYLLLRVTPDDYILAKLL